MGCVCWCSEAQVVERGEIERVDPVSSTPARWDLTVEVVLVLWVKAPNVMSSPIGLCGREAVSGGAREGAASRDRCRMCERMKGAGCGSAAGLRSKFEPNPNDADGTREAALKLLWSSAPNEPLELWEACELRREEAATNSRSEQRNC
mmetsp:Transcript_1826/g.4171  ORF Transcript_1826/g.4171 Transcript_1826/m.4171 type:complete len:148 (+) Transcript_1826:212-655(+)